MIEERKNQEKQKSIKLIYFELSKVEEMTVIKTVKFLQILHPILELPYR